MAWRDRGKKLKTTSDEKNRQKHNQRKQRQDNDMTKIEKDSPRDRNKARRQRLDIRDKDYRHTRQHRRDKRQMQRQGRTGHDRTTQDNILAR
jgi:hypothetical protein